MTQMPKRRWTPRWTKLSLAAFKLLRLAVLRGSRRLAVALKRCHCVAQRAYKSKLWNGARVAVRDVQQRRISIEQPLQRACGPLGTARRASVKRDNHEVGRHGRGEARRDGEARGRMAGASGGK